MASEAAQLSGCFIQVRNLVNQARQSDPSRRSNINDSALELFETSFSSYQRLRNRVNLPNVTGAPSISSSIAGDIVSLSQLAVVVAEAAIDTHHWLIAREVAEEFFSCDPLRDAAYCRMRLVLGAVILSETNGEISHEWLGSIVSDIMWDNSEVMIETQEDEGLMTVKKKKNHNTETTSSKKIDPRAIKAAQKAARRRRANGLPNLGTERWEFMDRDPRRKSRYESPGLVGIERVEKVQTACQQFLSALSVITATPDPLLGINTLSGQGTIATNTSTSVASLLTSFQVNPRYYHLVYNLSIGVWLGIRPFLRIGHVQLFLTTLQMTWCALEQTNEIDHAWRVEFSQATAFACHENNDLTSATYVLDTILSMLDTDISQLEQEINITEKPYQESKMLVDEALSAQRQLENIAELKATPPKVNSDLEPEDEGYWIYPTIPEPEGLAKEGLKFILERLEKGNEEMLKRQESWRTIVEQEKIVQKARLSVLRQRISLSPAEFKKWWSTPAIQSNDRLFCLLPLFAILAEVKTTLPILPMKAAEVMKQPTGGALEKERDSLYASVIQRLTQGLPSSASADRMEERAETILDACRLFLALGDISRSRQAMSIFTGETPSTAPPVAGAPAGKGKGAAPTVADTNSVKMPPPNAVMSRVVRIKADHCEALLKFTTIDSDVAQTIYSTARAVATKKLPATALFTTQAANGLRLSKQLEIVKSLERCLSLAQSVLISTAPYIGLPTPPPGAPPVSFKWTSRGDISTIQEICLSLWTALQPFLNRRHRPRIHSALRLLSTLVQTCQLVSLPSFSAALLYELALVEEQADYAGLAATEATLALQQDFGDLSTPTLTVNQLSEGDKSVLGDSLLPRYRDLWRADSSRPWDITLVPYVTGLAARVDVYNSPPTADAQVALWLQAAKESASGEYTAELVRKSAALIFAEMEKPDLGLGEVMKLTDSSAKSNTNGSTRVSPDDDTDTADGETAVETQTVGGDGSTVDWSLLLMRNGPPIFAPVPLDEIDSVLTALLPSTEPDLPQAAPVKGKAPAKAAPTTTVNTSPGLREVGQPLPFTFPLQTRVSNLLRLVEAAHRVKDSTILQIAALALLRLDWFPDFQPDVTSTAPDVASTTIDDTATAKTTRAIRSQLTDAKISVCELLADSLGWRLHHTFVTATKGLDPSMLLETNEKVNNTGFGSDKYSRISLLSADISLGTSLGSDMLEKCGVYGRDIETMKRLIIRSLTVSLVGSLHREDGLQVTNCVSRFWNLHASVFRRGDELILKSPPSAAIAVGLTPAAPGTSGIVDKSGNAEQAEMGEERSVKQWIEEGRDVEELSSIPLKEMIDFLRMAFSGVTAAASFGTPAAPLSSPQGSGTQPIIDLRLAVAVGDALTRSLELRGSLTEAISAAEATARLTLPSVQPLSVSATYSKRAIVEVGAILSFTAKGNGAPPANTGKTKGSAASGSIGVSEVVPDNALLSVFSNLAVGETLEPHSPLVLQIIERVLSLLSNEVPKQLANDPSTLTTDLITNISTGDWAAQLASFPLRERILQRFELLSMAYVRLSRLQARVGDCLAAESSAKEAVSVVEAAFGPLSSIESSTMGRRTGSTKRVDFDNTDLFGDDGDDDFSSKGKDLLSVLGKRLLRWLCLAKQHTAIAILVFIDSYSAHSRPGTATAKNVTGSLDTSLVRQLQVAALRTLLPAIRWALACGEESLVHRSTALAAHAISALLAAPAPGSPPEDADLTMQTVGYTEEVLNLLMTRPVVITKQILADASATLTASTGDGMGVVLPENLAVALSVRVCVVSLLHWRLRHQDWNGAAADAVRAFAYLPPVLQRAVWPARLVALSRRGQSLLAGLAALKNSNSDGDTKESAMASAAVQLFAARAAGRGVEALTAYRTAISQLAGRPQVAEVLLEFVEWAAGSGWPVENCAAVLDDAIVSIVNLTVPSVQESSVTPSISQTSSRIVGRGQTSSRSMSTQRASSRTLNSSRSVTGDVAKDEDILTFQLAETAVRAYVMRAQLESTTERRAELCIAAVAFIHRALCCWSDTLSASLSLASATTAISTCLESGQSGENVILAGEKAISEWQKPTWLVIPPLTNVSAICSWLDNLELAHATRTFAATAGVDVVEVAGPLVTAARLLVVGGGEGVPSYTSLSNCLAASVHYLRVLADELRALCLPSRALLVSAFGAALLRLTPPGPDCDYPPPPLQAAPSMTENKSNAKSGAKSGAKGSDKDTSPDASTSKSEKIPAGLLFGGLDDRMAPLLSFQLSILSATASLAVPWQASGCTTLSFVTHPVSGEALSPGQVVSHFLQTLDQASLSQPIDRSSLLDASLSDIRQAINAAKNSQSSVPVVDSAAALQSAFWVPASVSADFASAFSPAATQFWATVATQFAAVGAFDLAEQLVTVLMIQQRRIIRSLAHISGCSNGNSKSGSSGSIVDGVAILREIRVWVSLAATHLRLLALQDGPASSDAVATMILSLRPLLEAIGDVTLLPLFLTSLMAAYGASSRPEEAKTLAEIASQLFSDLSHQYPPDTDTNIIQTSKTMQSTLLSESQSLSGALESSSLTEKPITARTSTRGTPVVWPECGIAYISALASLVIADASTDHATALATLEAPITSSSSNLGSAVGGTVAERPQTASSPNSVTSPNAQTALTMFLDASARLTSLADSLAQIVGSFAPGIATLRWRQVDASRQFLTAAARHPSLAPSLPSLFAAQESLLLSLEAHTSYWHDLLTAADSVTAEEESISHSENESHLEKDKALPSSISESQKLSYFDTSITAPVLGASPAFTDESNKRISSSTVCFSADTELAAIAVGACQLAAARLQLFNAISARETISTRMVVPTLRQSTEIDVVAQNNGSSISSVPNNESTGHAFVTLSGTAAIAAHRKSVIPTIPEMPQTADEHSSSTTLVNNDAVTRFIAEAEALEALQAEASAPPSETDYIVPRVLSASQLAASATNALTGTSAHRLAILTLLTARVASLISARRFDFGWYQSGPQKSPPPSFTESNDDLSLPNISGVLPPTPTEIAALEELSKWTLATLMDPSTSLLLDSDLQYAVLTASTLLIDAYGGTDPLQAAAWTLRLQSANAANWLRTTWQSALPTKSPLRTALRRLEAISSANVGSSGVTASGGVGILSTPPMGSGILVGVEKVTHALSGGVYPENLMADNASGSMAETEATCLISSSTAWRRLRLETDVCDCLSTLIQNGCSGISLLSLQLCPQGHTLLLTVSAPLTPSGPATAASSKKPSNSAPVPDVPDNSTDAIKLALSAASPSWVVARYELSDNERRQLSLLITQHCRWKGDVEKFVATYSDELPDDICPEEPTGITLAGPNDAPNMGNDSNETPISPRINKIGKNWGRRLTVAQKAEGALEERLRALVCDLEVLLSPVLGPQSTVGSFLTAVHSSSTLAVPTVAASAQGKKAPNPTKSPRTAGLPTQPHLLLLLDPLLASLPFEALPSFEPFEGRVTRDFSISILTQRISQLSLLNSPLTAQKVQCLFDPLHEDRGVAPPSAAAAALVGIPVTGRPSIQENAQTLRTTIPGATQWQNLHSKEATSPLALSDFLREFLVTPNVQVPPAISPRSGASPPSSTLSGDQCLIVHTLGRLSAFLPPSELAGLDFSRLGLLLCCDRSHTEASSRRQNSTSVGRRPQELELEAAIPYAALLSLAGVGTIVLPGWSVPIAAQNRWLLEFWKHFSGISTTPGDVLSSWTNATNTRNVESNTQTRSKRWMAATTMIFGLPKINFQA